MTSPAQPKAVIFAAPGGWGKTHHASLLQRQFNCTEVIDGWCPDDGVTSGALHLTNCTPTELADWRQTIDDQTVVIDAGFFYTAPQYFVPVAGFAAAAAPAAQAA